MATKKRARKSGRAGSKTQFILGLPADMPAKDVVAKAATAGIKLSEKYVYNIRSSSRRKGGKPRRGPGRPPKAARKVARANRRGGRRPRAGATGGDLEQQLRAAIAEVGLARARAVFEEVVAAFAG